MRHALWLGVAALCALNALIILGNGLLVARAGLGLVASMVVALIYGLTGAWTAIVAVHLRASLRMAEAANPATMHSLHRLARWLTVGAAALGLVMLLSLTALYSRIREGAAIFG